MIKIGCNSLSVRDMGVEDFIRTCYELRLDSVDFHESVFASREPAYLASIKLLCLKYGLPIAYIGVSGLFHGTAEERKAHADNAKGVIDLAAFLGLTAHPHVLRDRAREERRRRAGLAGHDRRLPGGGRLRRRARRLHRPAEPSRHRRRHAAHPRGRRTGGTSTSSWTPGSGWDRRGRSRWG